MHENVLSNDSITDVMIWPGGLHMVDIEDPLNPQFLGCFAEDGYVHDSHCVIYEGPDTRWVLRSRLSLCHLRGTRYTVGFTFTTLTVSSTRDQIHGGFWSSWRNNLVPRLYRRWATYYHHAPPPPPPPHLNKTKFFGAPVHSEREIECYHWKYRDANPILMT